MFKILLMIKRVVNKTNVNVMIKDKCLDAEVVSSTEVQPRNDLTGTKRREPKLLLGEANCYGEKPLWNPYVHARQ